jgi:hypothetical protein
MERCNLLAPGVRGRPRNVDAAVAVLRGATAAGVNHQARRVFRNGSAQEQFRKSTEEDSARAFLDASATRRELTQNCLHRDRGQVRAT